MTFPRSTTLAEAGPPVCRSAAPRGAATTGLRTDPSLVQGLSCPDCGGARITRILLTLTDGTPVDFVSCQRCEYRAWRSADGALELDGVLSRARRERRSA